jgi:nucleotide-binding universal stress UspA family protein
LRDAGYAVEANFIQGQPDTAIAAYAESKKIDLLVMGAYGHSRLRNLIIGSTTTEMLRSCKIPVMLFR